MPCYHAVFECTPIARVAVLWVKFSIEMAGKYLLENSILFAFRFQQGHDYCVQHGDEFAQIEPKYAQSDGW